ncbi:dephospho-CoA kinase [Bacteroides sp. 224]|uniref:dephospho-CoA kinase n=1 Tax=Bacteroides sp. 224 TaxID=2302936 RepID=UPI0013D4E6EE|nr:dephospho-CoA kinase [Bacteroides sp. 224]NDV64813.1 dephospho-CoA kinase [Bacteroides sp. 224]
MTIKIGITGGIGSGKSVVSRLLEIMGIPVYISDVESKRLTISNPRIRRELIALLGEEVYKDNELNKPLLASYLFSDPAHTQQINHIIHPEVRKDFQEWVNRHKHHKIVAMESAILIEAGFANEVDKIVMIYAPLEIRIKRAVKRDSSTYEEIAKRIRNQMDDEEKRKQADFLICNDGSTPLIPQVKELLNSF